MVPTSHHGANFPQAKPMPRFPFKAGGGDYSNFSPRGIGTENNFQESNEQPARNEQPAYIIHQLLVAECQHLRVTLLSHQHISKYLQYTYSLAVIS